MLESRRSFLGKITAIASALHLPFARVAMADGKVLPGHRSTGPLGPLKVTPDMKVTLKFRSDGKVLFEGKTKDFRLSISPILGRKAPDDLPVFNAANLTKLPVGEFSYNDVRLSDQASKYQVTLNLDDLHFPDLEKLGHLEFEKATALAIADPGLSRASILLQIDDGPTVLIDGVTICNVNKSFAHVTKPGQRWGEISMIAKTASRVEK